MPLKVTKSLLIEKKDERKQESPKQTTFKKGMDHLILIFN
jgi:hypothetical protein